MDLAATWQQGQLSWILLARYEEELPPKGMLGIFDWHTRHALSPFMTTCSSQYTYIPTKTQPMLHAVVVDTGQSRSAKNAYFNNEAHARSLVNLCTKMRIARIGMSAKDFGFLSQSQAKEVLAPYFSGIDLWIMQ